MDDLVNNAASTPGASQPPSTSLQKDHKHSGLKKCFAALVDRKQVNLELDVLDLILRKELFLNMDNLPQELIRILPYILVYYIKNWPGWNKSVEYFSGNMTFKSWFDKFINFLMIKLNEAINNHYPKTVQKSHTISENSDLFCTFINHKETQTDTSPTLPASPYKINIRSRAGLLNTIAFAQSGTDDIIMKQHKPLEWDLKIISKITLKQIISWPHVAVSIWSPVFHFKRKVLHSFKRQVNLVGPVSKPTHAGFIEEVETVDSNQPTLCYSVDYIKNRMNQFINVLESKPNFSRLKLHCKPILEEILMDMEDLNVINSGKISMASNTKVLFNIGKKTYFRNKKLSKGIPSDIAYTEVIVPRVETSFIFLSRDEEFNAYLEELRKCEEIEPSISLPKITYGCTFCCQIFLSVSSLLNHLRDEHKMEQQMLCFQCKVPFLVFDLALRRWKHDCYGHTKT